MEKCTTELKAWTQDGLTLARALFIANHLSRGYYPFPVDEYPRPEGVSTYEGDWSLWSALDKDICTAEQARDLALPGLERWLPHGQRWMDHLTLRIGYERQFIGDVTPAEGDTPKVKSTRPKLPPIVNYDSEGMHHMTKAEWSAKHRDYKGTRKSEDRSYRYRVAMHNDTGNADRWSGMTLSPVFITDQKVVEPPEPELIAC